MVLALLLYEGLARGVAELVDEPFAVPAHWRAEAANGLLVAERRNRIGHAETVLVFPALLALPAQLDNDGLNGETGLFLARRHRLTFYDALYPELAQRRGLPLATLDAALRRAATAGGVTLLP